MTVRSSYFSDCVVARLACFLETYYDLLRAHSDAVFSFSFHRLVYHCFECCSAVSVKNKISHVCKYTRPSKESIDEFLYRYDCMCNMSTIFSPVSSSNDAIQGIYATDEVFG